MGREGPGRRESGRFLQGRWLRCHVGRDGLTLLETMVALVILSLVVVGYLEVFGATARSTRNAEDWSRAIAYAEEAMELAKLDLDYVRARGVEMLPGGFQRRVEVAPWSRRLDQLSVVITFPDGGRFALQRLIGPPR